MRKTGPGFGPSQILVRPCPSPGAICLRPQQFLANRGASRYEHRPTIGTMRPKTIPGVSPETCFFQLRQPGGGDGVRKSGRKCLRGAETLCATTANKDGGRKQTKNKRRVPRKAAAAENAPDGRALGVAPELFSPALKPRREGAAGRESLRPRRDGASLHVPSAFAFRAAPGAPHVRTSVHGGLLELRRRAALIPRPARGPRRDHLRGRLLQQRLQLGLLRPQLQV